MSKVAASRRVIARERVNLNVPIDVVAALQAEAERRSKETGRKVVATQVLNDVLIAWAASQPEE
jgi:pyruvate kinase